MQYRSTGMIGQTFVRFDTKWLLDMGGARSWSMGAASTGCCIHSFDSFGSTSISTYCENGMPVDSAAYLMVMNREYSIFYVEDIWERFLVCNSFFLYLLSDFQLGGGYLYGLLVGFVADSLGASFGATAAFLLGRTIGRSYVTAKIKDYPRFQAVAIAVQIPGYLHLVIGHTKKNLVQQHPITVALVYAGTTLKDLSYVTHGWHEFSPSRWIFLISSLMVSVILMICVTKVAKNALDKALAENVDAVAFPELPISVASPATDIRQPLMVEIDPAQEKQDSHEN